MNTDIIIRESSVKRSCLRVARIRRFHAAAIAALLLASVLVWLFVMKFSVSFSGFCYPSQNFVRFFFPVEMADRLHVGDDIWVGDERGKISYFEEAYISHDTLDHSTDSTEISFFNSDYFDPDETYRSGIAVFSEEIFGMYKYRVIQGEVTSGKIVYETMMRILGYEE